MSLDHVSLFAGVGGADLGMHAAGVDTLLACEIDKHARAVLAHRFPHATLHDDVRTLTGDHLRRAGAVPERTILSGGFPCQPFSVAGRRRGMGGDDERGDLYWQISRLLSEFPARWVVLENVPGLLSIDGGRTFGTILGDLADLGYGVAYRVLDAQHFGVPQRRRRVFIVGCLGDDRRPVEVLLEPEGGGRDLAASWSAGSEVASGTRARSLTTRVGQLDDQDTSNLVVGTLLANGGDRHVNDALDGRLVPYVKAKRAATDQDDETWRQDGVSPTLNVADNGHETRATVLALALRGRDEGAVPEVHGDGSTVGALRAASGGSSRDYVSVGGQGVVHALTAEGHDASEDGTGRGTPTVAFSHTAGIDAQASTEVAPSVLAGNDRMPAVSASTVRRLTPRECERLMGWPDDHTRHRIGPNGEPVEQADSHRYKQCGNGMAAPVVEWIARRIVEVDR